MSRLERRALRPGHLRSLLDDRADATTRASVGRRGLLSRRQDDEKR